MPAPRRADRVSREIQRELTRLLQREVRDPRAQEATITRVEVTDDLRECTAWFVPLGDIDAAEKIEELSKGLNKAAAFLQGRVGRGLRLRRTPRLKFEYDTGFKNLVHVHELLATLNEDPSE
ncbi:MAG: 30S ribosome-binding factor RbfA [Proteobacteria bacterium]|nr:30S ribosome-binding factor RbfA [Pseudomonadota bacterium]